MSKDFLPCSWKTAYATKMNYGQWTMYQNTYLRSSSMAREHPQDVPISNQNKFHFTTWSPLTSKLTYYAPEEEPLQDMRSVESRKVYISESWSTTTHDSKPTWRISIINPE